MLKGEYRINNLAVLDRCCSEVRGPVAGGMVRVADIAVPVHLTLM